ncbi:transcription initiation factor IIB 3, partial [Halobacteriales archaeon QH_8_68_33]
MERPSRQRERAESREKEQESEDERAEQTCPECDSAALVTSADGGEVVCEDCGLIIDEANIDRGPE